MSATYSAPSGPAATPSGCCSRADRRSPSVVAPGEQPVADERRTSPLAARRTRSALSLGVDEREVAARRDAASAARLREQRLERRPVDEPLAARARDDLQLAGARRSPTAGGAPPRR